MGVSHEPGVHNDSECFYPSPSPLARELLFYMTRYGHYICDHEYNFSDNSAIAQLEGHQNYFLFFIKGGRLNIENNGHAFSALAGQVGLVNCRQSHHYYAVEPLEYYWLHFDGVLAQKFCDKIIEINGGQQVFYPMAAKQVEQEYLNLLAELRSNRISEFDITQAIYFILCHLLVGYPKNILGSSDEAALAAIQYINENYAKNLSVEDVAAHVKLSYSRFARRFKTFSGHAIHEYITIRRLSEAKHLLSTTDMPLKEMSDAVGYHSESSFFVSFKSRCNCTPSEYRRLNSHHA